MSVERMPDGRLTHSYENIRKQVEADRVHSVAQRDEGSLQPYLDGVDRVVPDAIFVGSRDLGPRHQINVLRRQSPKRQTFSSADRLIFAGLYQFAPTVLDALAIVKPETVIKWHRAGFRSYWLRHADCLEQRLLSKPGRHLLKLSFLV